MDELSTEDQNTPERFPKSNHIELGSDGWLSPKGNYYKVGPTEHDESARFLVDNSSEVRDEEKRRFLYPYQREDNDDRNYRERLKELGWILINGPVFRTDNALNYTSRQLTLLSEAGIPIVGAFDGSKEFSSQETLDWVKKASTSISDYINRQKTKVWARSSNGGYDWKVVNQTEFWEEIKNRGYSTLEDFEKDPISYGIWRFWYAEFY